MKPNYSFLALTALAVLFCSCTAGRVVETNGADDFALSNYKTFNFYKTDLEIDQMPEFSKRVDWIKEAIKKNLTAKGLQYQPENADMLVNIGVFIEEKMQTRETDIRSDPPMYMGQRNYHWEVQEVPVGTYEEGTFTLDLIDKASNEMVWQGVAQSVITKKDETAKKNIAEVTEKLLADIE